MTHFRPKIKTRPLTREEILTASVKELENRLNALRDDPDTWYRNKSPQYREFLMISTQLCLIRTEFSDAADWAEKLKTIYGESLRG